MKKIALLALMTAVSACAPSRESAEATFASDQPSEPTRISVQVAPVSVEDVTEVLRLTGTARSWDEFPVNSEIPGRVRVIHADEGRFVARGELLLELDRERRELELRSRQAQLAKAGVDLEYAQRKLARGRALLEKGAISESEVESLEQAVELGESAVELAQIAVEIMEEELRDTRVHAPVAGQVSVRHVSLGETVNPATVLFTLIQIDPLKVVTEVAEADVKYLRVGQRVSMTFDALPGHEAAGRIRHIHPVTNPRSGSFPVEVRLSNRDRAVQPGMLVRLEVDGRTHRRAVVVPAEAVVEIEGRTYVFVVREGVAQRQEVGIDKRIDVRLIVRGENLAAGDPVVIKGNRNLTQGTPVEVVS